MQEKLDTAIKIARYIRNNPHQYPALKYIRMGENDEKKQSDGSGNVQEE